jgi:hypothetical protein
METYENRIVLFLDILGFQKIIEDTVESNEKESLKLSNLIHALKEMKKIVSGMNNKSSKIVTQFSDSIVLSFKEDDLDEIPKLLYDIQRLIVTLVYKGILCRGAISYGKLYHDKDIVLGPAIIDAYLTEVEAAIYPRIILDKSLINLLKNKYTFNNKHQYRGIRFQSDIESNLRIDSDDKFYVDYFAGGGFYFMDNELIKYFEILRRLIVKGLRFKSPGIRAKYGWMKNKFNMIANDFNAINTEQELFYKRDDIKEFVRTFKQIE